MRTIVLLLLLTAPAHAETVMTARDFEAFATGKTLDYYDPTGALFGTEAYLPGRKLLWQEPGKACSAGTWSGTGAALCFAYDGAPTPACWVFVRHEDGVVARFLTDPPDRELVRVMVSDRPLDCDASTAGTE